MSKMPVLFLGHGSPLNALEDNGFTRMLLGLGHSISRPRAILCISAHWMTKGSFVTHMQSPKTIHDFYGFPQALYDVLYPAPGSPLLAEQIQSNLEPTPLFLDDSSWGLDHGTWSVLKHMYPDASIPVLQLSLDMSKPFGFHVALGEKLREFRDQGVLIVGSGNIVHNLGKIAFDPDAQAYDWALEFDAWAMTQLNARNFKALTDQPLLSESGRLSIPTPDHYYPLLYALGASTGADSLAFEFGGMQHASISMRCLSFGLR